MSNVQKKMKLAVALVVLMVIILVNSSATAAGGAIIGSFGPTGVEVDVQKDNTLKVIGVQTGSPADGKFRKGQVITAVDGQKLVKGDIPRRRQLSDIITKAEATDGVIKFSIKGNSTPVVVKIPVLGAFSRTWPVNCQKTKKIIRAHADYISSLPITGRNSLSSHSLTNGLAVLTLLSTGQEKDLDVVRKIYAERMKGFKEKDAGPHTWNNGFQGIAVCEYYLRTGDESVIPLINAVCESARKYQDHGGWSHWATAINPNYTGGGLMNAAGTNVLTTLLLAKQCGAKVNDDTLLNSLKFFYRFAGHGANPYGDHRPEDGYGSNNGKTEMLAIAMNAASKAENGRVYAMARDKCASNPLYSYNNIMQGHAGPIGSMWHGVAAAFLIDKKPELYRNKMDQTRWFYELSRRFDGSFGMSGCQRFDDVNYGRSMTLSLTAPLKTLQITGAPRSKYAKSFTLPEHPWGRKADLEFFSLEGGPKYKPKAVPHVELASIADASEKELERFAYHPENAYRHTTADTIRKKGYFRLIEKLLNSKDPRARHTGCWAINRFQPWKVTPSPGWISLQAISKKDFTPNMLKSLIRIINNPDESIWNVDAALSALALASPQQTKQHLNDILPWLKYDEWWIHEAACQALSPALEDAHAIKVILPKIVDMLVKNDHIKGHGYVVWMLARSAGRLDQKSGLLISDALIDVYKGIPSQTWVEGDMDRSAITYYLLQGAAQRILEINPKAAVDVAKLTVTRKKDLSHRNAAGLLVHLKLLLGAVDKLDEQQKNQLGQILVEHYRPIIIEQNRKNLETVLSGRKTSSREMNDLIKIDGLVGANDGWKMLGNAEDATQSWSYYTFEPQEKLDKDEYNRYRHVTIPEGLKDWYKPEFDPAKNGFKSDKARIGDKAPAGYRHPAKWDKGLVKDAGEVILMRKVVELDNLDFARLRLMAYSRQGYRIYINGNLVRENKGRSKNWSAHQIYLDDRMKKHLKKGKNVIAAIGFLQYFRGKEGNIEVFLEGLKEYPELDVAPGSKKTCPANGKLKIFIVSGQSNMVGFGQLKGSPGTMETYVKSNPKAYGHLVDKNGEHVVRDDVWIVNLSYADKQKQGWLTTGYGGSEGHIGPEYAFGFGVGDYFEDPVLIIKSAWGGRSLSHNFLSPGSKKYPKPQKDGDMGFQYAEVLRHVKEITGNLKKYYPGYTGNGYEIIGFGWHQGWNDRINQAAVDVYEENMVNFVNDIRKDLGVRDMPFVIANTGMGGWDIPETARYKKKVEKLMEAQLALADAEKYPQFKGNVAGVETRGFQRPLEQSPSRQDYHWMRNWETYYLIGKSMADAMVDLVSAKTE